jgi:hypothetical protein
VFFADRLLALAFFAETPRRLSARVFFADLLEVFLACDFEDLLLAVFRCPLAGDVAPIKRSAENRKNESAMRRRVGVQIIWVIGKASLKNVN